VFEVLQAAILEGWGNASSMHAFGQRARKLAEEARVRVAGLIGARPDEIVFTSGGTESNNLAVKGALEAGRGHDRHLVISAIEHPCVMEAASYAERRGWKVSRVKVDGHALVDPGEVKKALDGLPAAAGRSVLVSVMLANNETGTIEPVGKIARIAKEHGGDVHTDATQAVGRHPVDVKELGVDYLTLSAHKFHGPQGAGALYVRRGARLAPLLHGGGQEGGRRSGTLNVPGIAGLGAAADLARRELDSRARRVAALRDRLEKGIVDRIEGCHLNGHPESRLPGHLNVSFDSVEGEALLFDLDMAGVACSTGSACSSGSVEPSHVLAAMGLSRARARGALRFSLSHLNSEEEVDAILGLLPQAVERLRRMSPPAA
jgi:cysteine desulfurase